MTQQLIADDDPLLGTDFMIEVVRQLRSLDAYGVWERRSNASLIDTYLLDAERRRAIPLVGDPDEETIWRVRAFYSAIACLIEKECGLMAVTLVHLSHEGFGRVVLTVGKLVVCDRTLRDVHRFGFASASKMKDDADSLLAVALNLIGRYPEVAGL